MVAPVVISGKSSMTCKSKVPHIALPTRREADPPDLTCSRSRHTPAAMNTKFVMVAPLVKSGRSFVSLTNHCKLCLRQSPMPGLALNIRNREMSIVCPINVCIGQDRHMAWNLPLKSGSQRWVKPPVAQGHKLHNAIILLVLIHTTTIIIYKTLYDNYYFFL